MTRLARLQLNYKIYLGKFSFILSLYWILLIYSFSSAFLILGIGSGLGLLICLVEIATGCYWCALLEESTSKSSRRYDIFELMNRVVVFFMFKKTLKNGVLHFKIIVIVKRPAPEPYKYMLIRHHYFNFKNISKHSFGSPITQRLARYHLTNKVIYLKWIASWGDFA